MRNNNGSSTVPCGTADATGDTDDILRRKKLFEFYSPGISRSIECFFFLYRSTPVSVIISACILYQTLC